MTQHLESACTNIGTVLSSIASIDQVFINPPETINTNTILLVFPESGEKYLAPIGTRLGLHQIAIYLMQRRTTLQNDITVLKPFIDIVIDALNNEFSATGGHFNNSITTFEKVSYKFEFLDYAAVDYAVYHFVMENVKIIE